MATIRMTGLSGNEIYCMNLKGMSPKGILVGNSVHSMGFIGGLRSAFSGVVGGEITDITAVIHEGRETAFNRMFQEAKQEGVQGIVGVSSELRNLGGNTEFLFVGSGVTCAGHQTPFSSAGDAQELYCHMDAGYQPLRFAFGNIAYSVGVAQGLFGALKTLARGEIKEFSDVFNETRHHALTRLIRQAKAASANAVVGIRTHIMWFAGAHEMYMTGTAARHDALALGVNAEPVTSDLTGEELWSLSSMGYAPVKLLISTSIYSLGLAGGIMSALKSFTRGEINELSTLVYEARENVFDRIRREAEALGAEEVVGIKTYIVDLGGGLIEILAIGTAVKKLPGIAVATPALPPQAIIRDRDTWVSGDAAFDVESVRAGG